ncbi:hypothetical protein [Anaerosporobacter sp.]
MNYGNSYGTTTLEGEEPPKRVKKKGIRGRSRNITIEKRKRLIREILSDKDLEEYTEQNFKEEFKRRCKELGLTYPSIETIRTDLLDCDYKLTKGKFLKRSNYNPLSIEMLQYLFKGSLVSRLTVQIKSDEYILLPIIVQSMVPTISYDNKESTIESDEIDIDVSLYYEEIYSSINNSYNNITSTSIHLTFNKTGYEGAILQLMYDIYPERILSFSANTYGLTLYSTVANTCSLLELIYTCLPNNLDILEVPDSKQPF